MLVKPSSVKKIIPERIAGSDLFWDLARIAQDNKYKIFLLGGKGDVPQKTQQKLEERFPKIEIAGFSNADSENNNLISEINKSNADFVFVAWGQPKQEVWIRKNISRLDINLAIGLGGTFDFVSGKKKRAPKWMRKKGLEWLWRFMIEPKRLARTIAAVPKFIYAICREKVENPEREIIINGDKN